MRVKFKEYESKQVTVVECVIVTIDKKGYVLLEPVEPFKHFLSASPLEGNKKTDFEQLLNKLAVSGFIDISNSDISFTLNRGKSVYHNEY